ncbi:MAG: hypothetical protein C0466_08155 [Candidatus Accumulibacter sp.]|nr:hypothetical protein [Accumulibacter sp.]
MSNPSLDPDPGVVSLFTGELDDMACKAVEKRRLLGNEVTVLLFGQNVGTAAVRMAAAGARVVVDSASGELPSRSGLRAAPLPDVASFPEAPFDLIVGQLALHPLRYEEARRVVRQLLLTLKIGGKIYLSAYGLHSTLGDHYPDSDKLIEERYAALPPTLAASYGLRGPLCLYSERNLITLLFGVGASVLQSATGAFGNVRAVAVRV